MSQVVQGQSSKGRGLLYLMLAVVVIKKASGADDWSHTVTDILASNVKGYDSIFQVFPNITSDLGVVGRFLEAQIFRANLNDTLCNSPLLNENPGRDGFKMRLCERKDVNKCMLYGNSTNRLPKQLRGVWWQEGIQFDEELISPVGEWYPNLRLLVIDSHAPRNWGSHGTSTVLDSSGLFYRPSGAAHFNWLACIKAKDFIFFNEDITVGQILGAWTVLNKFVFLVPPQLGNWTMTLLPDGSWERKSLTIGLPTNSGDYFLRSVVDEEGNPGPYYNEWVKDRKGEPFIYLDRVQFW